MKFVLFLAVLMSWSCSSKKDEPQNNDNKKDNKDEEVVGTNGRYAVVKAKNGKEYHTGLLPEMSHRGLGESHIRFTSGCEDLPKEFDLRDLNLVPDIRDQGQCGSCWAFSKTASLESALLGQGIKLDLAEQELVSCDREQYGCNGGLLSAFKYQINHGQSLEKDFPYTSGRTGRNGSCRQAPVAAKGVSFQYVGTADRGPTDDELKCALYTYKTVPWITVSASNAWGSPPSSYKTAYNRCRNGQTNHAVGVVGWWTDAQGKTQFIMKNSWGTSWGDQGYMSLPLGCDAFGEEVGFIQVADQPNPPTPPGPGPGPNPPGPGPCAAPKVKMAAEVQAFPGTEVMLGVKPEAGVTYTWTVDNKVVGNEAMLYVVPPKDAVYKLTGKNSCAVAESLVRVRIVHSFHDLVE